MRFATHIKVELIREDIKIGLSWFEKMHNVKPKTIHNYYIKYRSIGYHGLIPLYKTDSNNFQCMLSDGVIIETLTLKDMYKNMRTIVKNEIEFIDSFM